MAGASKGISAGQICWMRIFHTRSETYRAAQACITDAHSHHPERQNGRVVRRGILPCERPRGDINVHYGNGPGSKFYSHLSDRYGYFSILPIRI